MHQSSSVARFWESYTVPLSHVFPKSTQSSADEVLSDVAKCYSRRRKEPERQWSQTDWVMARGSDFALFLPL